MKTWRTSPGGGPYDIGLVPSMHAGHGLPMTRPATWLNRRIHPPILPGTMTATGSSKTAGTTLALTTTGGVEVGESIFVAFSFDYVAADPTCADSLGNTYTKEYRLNNSTIIGAILFRSIVTVAGTPTITVTHSSLTARAGLAASFKNVGTQRATGGFAQAANVGAIATPGTADGSAVAGVAKDLWIGAFALETAIGNAFSPGVSASPLDAPGAAEPVAESGTTGGSANTNAMCGMLYYIVPDETARRLRGFSSASSNTVGAGASYAPL